MENKKLAILVLSWRGLGHPKAGGAEIATYEHMRGWVAAGHKVVLFTSSYQGAKSRENVSGIEVIRHGPEAFGVHIAAFFWYFFGRHERFDVVVDEFHGIPFFTPLYVRVKKVAFIHEVAKEVWWFNPWPWPFNFIPAVIGTVFERLVFNLVYRNTRFMTVSASTKADLVKWGIASKNVTVVSNGVNVVSVSVNKAKIKTVIYLGALTKDKGIEDALAAFALINQKDSNWHYWIVGRGEKPYIDSLGYKAASLGLKAKVKFWGFVTETKKFELLARSHVLINPSIREGWGLVNIEANAVGTPVVGYRVVGVRDSVQDGITGMLCDLHNVGQLAEKVLSLGNDPKMYARLSRNAKDWSKKFDWEIAREKSLEIIED